MTNLNAYQSLYEATKITPEKANATIIRNLLVKELPRVVPGAKFEAGKNFSGSSNPYSPIQDLRMIGLKNKHKQDALVKIATYLKSLGFKGDTKPDIEKVKGYPKESIYSIDMLFDTDKLDHDYYDHSKTTMIPIRVHAMVTPDSETGVDPKSKIWITISGPKAAKRPPGPYYD